MSWEREEQGPDISSGCLDISSGCLDVASGCLEEHGLDISSVLVNIRRVDEHEPGISFITYIVDDDTLLILSNCYWY